MAYPSKLNWTYTYGLPDIKYFNQTFQGTLGPLREDIKLFEEAPEYKIRAAIYNFFSKAAKDSNGITLCGTTDEDDCINLICGNIEEDIFHTTMFLWGFIDGKKDYLYNYDFMIMQATGFINLLKTKGVKAITTMTNEPSKNTEYFHKEWPGLELFKSIEIVDRVVHDEINSTATRYFEFL